MNFLKSIWLVVVILLLLNTLAIAAGIGWLYSSHRLSSKRVHQLVDLFRPTLEQEEQSRKQAELAAADDSKQKEKLAWLQQASDGPATLAEKLRQDQQAREIAAQKSERLSRDVSDLRQRLESDTTLLAKQRAELEARKKEIDEQAQHDEKLRNDADFQQTVTMYEKLPAKQAKQMLQAMLAANKKEQVVDYLASMQLRKATGVLKEFKTPQEITQASELLELLRRRGVDPMPSSSQNQHSKAPA